MGRAPEPPNACPPPSPLEVGQLLLQQEHVGFELIPLLKDLLKLLSTEAALPCLGGAPWLLQGTRLQEDRLGQRGASTALPCARAITGILGQVTGSETWELRALQQMADQCSAERGSRGRPGPRTVCRLPPSRWTCCAAQHTLREGPASTGPVSTVMGPHRVLRGPRGSCVGGGPLGLLPLFVPGPSGLVPRQLHDPLAR